MLAAEGGPDMTIRICIAGATGWTGSALARRLLERPGKFQLVAAIARKSAGKDAGEALGLARAGWKISADLAGAVETPFDVLIDYTKPDSVKARVLDAVARGLRVVVGTSGMTAADYGDIERAAREKGVGVVAAGNFSITAALIKTFALQAKKHLSAYELIDYAVDTKVDAPSGTVRELSESLGGKGAVHSVRLPGYVIGFEAIFGAAGERLSLRHDAGSSAEPYVAGTLVAAERVMELRGLLRGFDNVLAMDPGSRL